MSEAPKLPESWVVLPVHVAWYFASCCEPYPSSPLLEAGRSMKGEKCPGRKGVEAICVLRAMAQSSLGSRPVLGFWFSGP